MAIVNVDFIADVSQASKEVSNFVKKASKEFDGLSKTFTSFSSIASGAFAAIGVGFSLKKAIDEAAAFEVEVNRLTTAFELSGITSSRATDDFIEYASALQKSTKFSDDAVLSTASLIQSISKLPTDQLQRATKASLDLATALRIDVDTAARVVAKSAEGNVEALKKYGIEVEKGANKSESFANVLTALEAKFGGSSEKAVNTYTGAIAQLQNAANDAIKAFGTIIIKNPDVIKALNSTASAFLDIADQIENSSSKFGKFISFLAKTADLLKRFSFGFSIADLADKAPEKFKETEEAFYGLNNAAKAYRTELGKQNAAVIQANKDEEARARFLELAKKQFEETKSSFTALDSKFKTFNLDPVKQEINVTNKNLADLDRARRAGIVSDVNYQDLRLKIQQDGDKRLLKLSEETNKKRSGIIQGVVSGIGQGAAGVAGVASGLLSNLGPYGAAAGAALQFLSQGPEAVKAQLQGFIDGIPQIIDAVAAAIPVVVEVLAANSGKITTALSLQMPIVANKLAIELVKQSPNIARSFANSLIAEAGRIAQSIADGVKDAFGKGLGGAGSTQGLIGGAISGAKKIFGFADGGIVPGGAPFSDRIPALLTPGEYVLSRDDVKNLVTNSEKQAAPNRTTEMVTINLQIGQEKLASVIYDLSKRGFRLA